MVATTTLDAAAMDTNLVAEDNFPIPEVVAGREEEILEQSSCKDSEELAAKNGSSSAPPVQNIAAVTTQSAKRRWPTGDSSDGPYLEKDNKLFKTEMCWYAAGECRRGSNCIFAHTKEELRPPPPPRASPGSLKLVNGWRSGRRKDVCKFFVEGCCWYDEYTCYFKHDLDIERPTLKTMLCKDFMESGKCSRENCTYAHGQHELQTPRCFEGAPGYKTCLCTFFLLDELECEEINCFDAHGELDLRRLPMTAPQPLSRLGTPFEYSDAHIHLDHVLLTRRYGNRWYYKREWCRFKSCNAPEKCLRAHSAADKKPPLPVELEDVQSLAAEMQAMPVASFRGCVHSCCEVHSIELTLKLVRWGREVLDGCIYAAFGVHPVSYRSYTPEAEEKLLAALKECGPQGVAWGECGLDYYRLHNDLSEFDDVRSNMKEVFVRQVQVAVRHALPLVVHSRDAEEDTFSVLLEHLPRDHPVYFHSYTGALEIIPRYLSGWPRSYIGITGCVSYSTAVALQDIARATPMERLMLETDGPYMAPVPYRGEASHPGYIPWVAESVARVKGLSAFEVLAASHKNFRQFYQI